MKKYSCFLFLQIIQELEKQRIEILSNILNKYGLYMSSFGQTLLHVRTYDAFVLISWSLFCTFVHSTGSKCYGSVLYLQCQKQIEQAIKTVDMEKDLQSLVDQTSVTAEDNKAEFLMADYFVRPLVQMSKLFWKLTVLFIPEEKGTFLSRLCYLGDLWTAANTTLAAWKGYKKINIRCPLKVTALNSGQKTCSFCLCSTRKSVHSTQTWRTHLCILYTTQSIWVKCSILPTPVFSKIWSIGDELCLMC